MPLPPAGLQALPLPPLRALELPERLLEMADATPFPQTRALATLARMALAAPRNSTDAERARAAVSSDDERLRQLAALTLGHWRFTTTLPYGAELGPLKRALYAAFQAGFLPAAVGLSLLNQLYVPALLDPVLEVPAELLTHPHPDVAFGAAVALGEPETLRAVLRDPQGQPDRLYAAALGLTRHGHAGEIGAVLPQLAPQQQARLLELVRYREGQAVPALRRSLQSILAQAVQERVGHEGTLAAAALLAQDPEPEDVPLILQAVSERAPGYAGMMRALLQAPRIGPDEVWAVAAALVRCGQLSAQAPPFPGLADTGHLDDRFVPALFEHASPQMQQELGTLAARQLVARQDPALHRFLWTVLADVTRPDWARTRAWSALSGWYFYAGAGPQLDGAAASARHFFGQATAFAAQVCSVTEWPPGQHMIGFTDVYSEWLRVLGGLDGELIAALEGHPVMLARLTRALWAVAADRHLSDRLRGDALRALGLTGNRPGGREALTGGLWALCAADPGSAVQRAAVDLLTQEEEGAWQQDVHQALQGHAEQPYTGLHALRDHLEARARERAWASGVE